ncbi:molybdopterin molybdotransferase MoeA [Deferribacteraceae bacterium V6Fe1]|nr:molybdopterin molybdotransferase MoeA [Deferribacteraceae bacterium V6Fe1]
MAGNLIRPLDALNEVLKCARIMSYELVDIFSAPGRTIFENPVSKRFLPPLDNSAMDGYAVKFEDIKNLPAKLKVIGNIQAGDSIKGLTLNSGEAFKIMTGAFVPGGADTVVEYEVTEQIGEEVTILKEKKKGANIRVKGEDIAVGSVIDVKGKVVTPEIYARLISVGVNFVKVYTKPKALVIGTGNELAYPGDNSDSFKTIDANSFYISNLLKSNGAEVTYLGIAKDSVDDLVDKIKFAKNYDFIVTSAGISEGDFDVVTNSGKTLAINWIFKGVSQKPGKPFSFGLLGEKPIFALPGNPVSSAFCTFFYILPFLKKMTGLDKYINDSVTATITVPMFKKNKRVHFNRGILKYDNVQREFMVTPYVSQDSHIISSIASSNCYIEIDEDTTGEIEVGSQVKCYIYDKNSIF